MRLEPIAEGARRRGRQGPSTPPRLIEFARERGVNSAGPPRADREPGVNVARTLPLAGPAYVVWGAGTDVGKTLISAAICNFLGRAGSAPGVPGNAVFYYKPVQTGFPEDSDADNIPDDIEGNRDR